MNTKKYIILGAIILPLLFLVWKRSQLLKAVESLKTYIDTSSAAATWKSSIKSKASTAGRTYEQQLQADALYAVKQDAKYKTFAWLLF